MLSLTLILRGTRIAMESQVLTCSSPYAKKTCSRFLVSVSFSHRTSCPFYFESRCERDPDVEAGLGGLVGLKA